MQSNTVWGSREVSPPPVKAIYGYSGKKRKTLVKRIVSLGKDIIIGIISNIISGIVLSQELLPHTRR